MISFTATNFASVELLVTSFCFVDTLRILPLPMLKVPPVWLFMSSCTAKDPSAHHFRIFDPSADNVSGKSMVFFTYLNSLTSFFQTSTSGDFTRVDRKEIAVIISPHALFVTNNNFATAVWNAFTFFSSSFSASSFVTNKKRDAGVVALPLISSGKSAIVSSKYVFIFTCTSPFF